MNIFSQKIIKLVCILPFFISLSSFANSKNIINNIDIDNKKNTLNIKVNSSLRPDYKIFTLKEPNRLVVDIKNSKFKNKLQNPNPTLVKSFRNSARGEGVRIVFEFNNKIRINSHSKTLGPKNNILISLFVDKKNNKKYALKNLDSLIEETTLKKSFTSKPIKKKPVKNTAKKKKIIVIDAGHGGKDPGAIGRYYKTYEKKVTLAFAKEIRNYMRQYKGFKVYLTRDKDYFISLGGRVKKSQKLNADLFISIHADSAKNRKASGLSIYTLSETSSDKEAAKLAEKENKSDIIGGVNLSATSDDILKILIDLSQRSTMNNSAKFAEFAIKKLAKKNINVRQNTHRFAGFRVLTAPDVPSILIELGYLSNKKDEKKLNSPSYRRKFAKEFSLIIKDYFK